VTENNFFMNAKRKQCGQLAGQAKTGYDECMNGDKEKVTEL